MATKATDTTITVTKSTENESTYSAIEFANAARKMFGVSPDIVTAAFAVNNLKEATVAEAKKIVTTFANKEVK